MVRSQSHRDCPPVRSQRLQYGGLADSFGYEASLSSTGAYIGVREALERFTMRKGVMRDRFGLRR